MKWILIIALISAIMLIAFSLSEQYKDRFDFYSNLKSFLTEFKINVKFKQEKIIEFLDKIKCKKQFSQFVADYKEYLKTNNLSLDNIKLLDEDDKNILRDLISSLGKHNVENEIGQVDALLSKVDLELSKAEKDKNRLCPMIIKLSLLFAVGLAILLC